MLKKLYQSSVNLKDLVLECEELSEIESKVIVGGQGGPRAEKNFGQCKKEFNEKPCENFFR